MLINLSLVNILHKAYLLTVSFIIHRNFDTKNVKLKFYVYFPVVAIYILMYMTLKL